MSDLIITADGPQPQTPTDLNAQILALAQSLAPGLTVNLPGSLIEDVSSTETASLVLIDLARVETVNSLNPRTANLWLLTQLAQIYLGAGSTAAPPTNTSVFVVFNGTPGFTVGPGFVVANGSNQFTVQDGGIIATGGSTQPLFCLATVAGSFAVPANSVTTLGTSAPISVGLTVTNPLAGTPGGVAQTADDRRAQVLQAGLVASTGTPAYLRTLLRTVPGVQSRLISVRVVGDAWEIIVGGNGDPYEIGYAIFRSGVNIATLAGSTIGVVSITKANPGVVVTDLNHGYATGQVVEINGALGMTAVNGVPFTVTVVDEKTFSIGVDTTGYGTYTGGGVVTPNFRNVVTSIDEYPDTYSIPFVMPPLQNVVMTITWNTISPNFVASVGVAQLAQPAIAAYVNAIPVSAPINVFELEDVFANAIASILPRVLLTRMVFTVSINGVVTDPGAGTEAIFGDPESYFVISSGDITVIQG